MTRDPRKDPQSGDHLERGGVVRRVLDVGSDHVRFDLPGMSREKPKRVERATWDRWAKRARPVAAPAPVEHRDLKPESVPADYLRALDAVAMTTTTSGWSVEGSGRLRAIAELSHGTWQRAVAWLRAHGLLLTRRAGRGDDYQVTEAGRRALDDRPTGPRTGPRGPVNQPTWADRPAHRPTEGGRGEVLVGSSSSPNPKREKNNEPTNEPAHAGQGDRPTDRPTGPRPAHDRPTRTLVVEHVHRLSDEDRALLSAYLASRSTLPALSPAARPSPASEADPGERRLAPAPTPNDDPRPEPDHPAPPCAHCGHPTMALVHGPRGWFWGCPLWRVRDCPGLSLDEARAAWLEAQRAAAVERRREEERAERERERLRALNDDRPSLLSDPAQLERILRASSRQA